MGKKIFLVLHLLCASLVLAGGEEPAPALFSQFREDLAFFSTQFPRFEGTQQEADTVRYIQQRLDTLQIDYQQQDFSSLEEGHSFSTTLTATIPGDSEDVLVCVFPLNNEEEDTPQRDGAVNLAIALTLAQMWSVNAPPVTVELCFLGAEFGTEPFYPLGTKQFLDDFFPQGEAAVLYFNLKSAVSGMLVRTGGNSQVTPHWLVKRCSAALQESGLPARMLAEENQLFRMGRPATSLLSEPYLEDGFPVLLFQSSAEGVRSSGDQRFDTFLSFIDTFMQENRKGFPAQWDRHYLFFRFGSDSYLLSETTYVLMLVALFSFFTLYMLIFRLRVIRYRKIILSHYWAVPALFAIIFAFFFVSTLFVEALSALRNFPGLWRTVPTLFFLAKLCISFFLFFLLYWIVQRVPFPREKSFYSANAILLLVLNTIVISIFNISLAYYFAWAFIWAFLFTIFRSKFLKLCALLIAPLWIVTAIIDIFTLPALSICGYIIFSRFYGNLLAAFLLLPFILMVIRMEFYSRHHTGRREQLFITSITSFLGLATVGLVVFLFTFSPFNENNPQPVSVQETIDPEAGQRVVSVESPALLTGTKLVSPDYPEITAAKTRSFSVESETIPEIVTIDTTSRGFLDRKYITVTVACESEPHKIDVMLRSQEDITLFDCSFPYSLYPATNAATIYIGKNPPTPLEFRFTVPESLSLDATVEVEFTSLPHTLRLDGKNLEVDKKLTVIKRFTFEQETEIAANEI